MRTDRDLNENEIAKRLMLGYYSALVEGRLIGRDKTVGTHMMKNEHLTRNGFHGHGGCSKNVVRRWCPRAETQSSCSAENRP